MSNRYKFRFRGRIPATAREELLELDLEDNPELTETVMIGDVEDSAALNGLLRRFELLGIDVVDVHRSPGHAHRRKDVPPDRQGSSSS